MLRIARNTCLYRAIGSRVASRLLTVTDAMGQEKARRDVLEMDSHAAGVDRLRDQGVHYARQQNFVQRGQITRQRLHLVAVCDGVCGNAALLATGGAGFFSLGIHALSFTHVAPSAQNF
jgi:hypothetical protein